METAAAILVVDDDPGQRQLLESFLRGQGFPVETAASGPEALARLGESGGARVAMVISDVRMPAMSGLEMLRQIRPAHPRLPVLLVTAYADIRDAVEAMRDGAVNYLEKPIDLDELLASVRLALGAAVAAPAPGGAPEAALAAMRDFICQSAAMREAAREILAVAATDSRVLITGASGAGKEAAARVIHRLSPRAGRPVLRLHCAAAPPGQIEAELFGIEPGAFDEVTVPAEGLLEQAEGGTLILSEISELAPAAQARLLRLIETGGMFRRVGGASDRRADVRLLATTGVDLEEAVEAGRFREDLYYRICVFEIHIPPLAERRDDILPLAHSFLEAAGIQRPRFSPAAIVCLESCAWPGNVRELKNAMERAALLSRGDVILPEHLPRRVRESAPAAAADAAAAPAATMDDIERSVILQTLRENRYNRSETARRLGISRRALIYKLRRFRAQGFSIEPAE